MAKRTDRDDQYNPTYGHPWDFAQTNLFYGRRSPSQMHIEATKLNRFYERYFYQLACSIFEFDIPDEWSKPYFYACVVGGGRVGVLDTPRYGVICQYPNVGGKMNLYYEPAYWVISNPLLPALTGKPLQYHKDIEIIRIANDFQGLADLISHYANLSAITVESTATNIFNSRLSWIFGAESNAEAKTFEGIFDRVSAGVPAVATSSKLFDDQGKPRWQPFDTNLKQNFIANDQLTALRGIRDMFLTELGIPNANTDKRERLNTFEVNSNNIEVASNASLRLENLKEGCDAVNKLFGDKLSKKLSVKMRFDINEVPAWPDIGGMTESTATGTTPAKPDMRGEQ